MSLYLLVNYITGRTALDFLNSIYRISYQREEDPLDPPLHYHAVLIKYCLQYLLAVVPSKNRSARNIQILQVFFLQNLQDLAINLASFELNMKLFLQDMKNLARKICNIIFLQCFDEI